MDKLINRVERDMKSGDKAKGKKDMKALKKEDKKEDKAKAMCKMKMKGKK